MISDFRIINEFTFLVDQIIKQKKLCLYSCLNIL